MNPLTPELLRHWIDLLREPGSVRLPKVLGAREWVRRGVYERDAILDSVAEIVIRAIA